MCPVETANQTFSDLVDVVEEIARGAELLALNAVMEAAGAGRRARELGVVAFEVRDLARRSASAAAAIGPLIETCNAAAPDAQSSAASAAAARKIVLGLNRISDIITDIDVISEQRAGTIEQLNRVVEQLGGLAGRDRAEPKPGGADIDHRNEVVADLMTFYRLGGITDLNIPPASERRGANRPWSTTKSPAATRSRPESGTPAPLAADEKPDDGGF